LKQHKTCFDEKFLRFVDQTKQVKIQWLQDPNRKSIDNINTVRQEASRYFRKKKKECPKAKIDELETNSKIKKMSETYIGLSVIFSKVTNL
jgi:hypothetical protein